MANDFKKTIIVDGSNRIHISMPKIDIEDLKWLYNYTSHFMESYVTLNVYKLWIMFT